MISVGSDKSDGVRAQSMPRIFGYARPVASAADAKVETEGLAAAGAEAIFVETNAAQARRGLRERRRLFDQITSGDTLVLQSLQHLGTTLEEVLNCFAILAARGVTIRIIGAGFETVPDQPQRDLLKLLTDANSALRSEAIKTSLAAARAKGGKQAGSPSTLTPEQWADIETRIRSTSVETVAKALNVSRQTLWNYRRRMAKKTQTVLS